MVFRLGDLIEPSSAKGLRTDTIQLIVDNMSNTRLLEMEEALPTRLGKARLLENKVDDRAYNILRSCIQSAKIRRNL